MLQQNFKQNIQAGLMLNPEYPSWTLVSKYLDISISTLDAISLFLQKFGLNLHYSFGSQIPNFQNQSFQTSKPGSLAEPSHHYNFWEKASYQATPLFLTVVTWAGQYANLGTDSCLWQTFFSQTPMFPHKLLFS